MAEQQRSRNVPVDMARALSILVVVWFHLSFFRLTPVDSGGSWPELTISMKSVGPIGWLISWFLQIMPLFFVAGGFANTLVVDRLVREGHGYGHYLARRGRRLIGPLGLYLGAATVLGTVLAWVVSPDTGASVSHLATNVLWFLAAYLVIVLIAPAMVVAHDRWGTAVLAVLLAGSLLVDAASFATGQLDVRELNLLFVWPFAHQLGIAYGRGWLRHQRPIRSWLTMGAAVLGIVALLRVAPYPTTAVGIGDQMVSNMAPPTTPLALLALAQCAALALFEHYAGRRLRTHARVQKVVGVLNALAMTVYLWHLPIIALSVGLLLLPSLIIGHPVAFILSTPFYILVAVPLMVLLVPFIGRAERALIPPMGERQSAVLTLGGMLVLMIGLQVIRSHGMALHPAIPWSGLGPVLFAAGAAMLARGSNLPDPALRHRGGRSRQGHDESVVGGDRA